MPHAAKRLRLEDNDLAAVQNAHERSRKHLKSRLENVIEKYSKDYSDVSDVIDIHSGQVEVNNGHLRRMRNDRDLGRRYASVSQLAAAETGRRVHKDDDQRLNESGDELSVCC